MLIALVRFSSALSTINFSRNGFSFTAVWFLVASKRWRRVIILTYGNELVKFDIEAVTELKH